MDSADVKRWRMALKAGDEVVLRRGYHHEGTLRAVAKVTEKQVVIDDGVRFWREDGRRVGGNGERFYTLSLEEPTPEAKARIRHKDLFTQMQAVNWAALPLETLEGVRAALDAQKKSP